MSLQQNPVRWPPQGLTETFTRSYQIAPPQGITPLGDIVFQPNQVPDLEMWFDAADPNTINTGIGDQVTVWEDKSGNGHDASQVVSVDQPLTNQNLINGLNVLTFNPNEFLEIPFSAGVNPLEPSIFFVFRVPAFVVESLVTTNTGPLFDTGGFVMAMTSANFLTFVSEDGVGFEVAVSTAVPAANTPTIFHIEHENTPQTQQFVNGVLDGTVSTFPITYTASRNMEIGSFQLTTTANRLDGDIGEILVYDRRITPAERTQIIDYLKGKWGIP